FSLDDDMELATPQQQPIALRPKSKPAPQPVDTDSGLELDLDFSLDDDMELATSQQQPIAPPPKSKPSPEPIDTDGDFDLDLDFSLDDDMELATPQQQPVTPTPNSKPAPQPVDTNSDFDLDMDFSLDDDMELSTPQQQPIAPPPKSKPAPQPVDTDSGIELDMDFSLNDDMEFSAPQQPTAQPPTKSKPAIQPIDTDSGIELDIDFSFDDDINFSEGSKSSQQTTPIPAIEKKTSQNKSSIDFNDDLSLDVDFSLDSDLNNASTLSQKNITQASKTSVDSLKMENELELSMDFSSGEEISMDNSTNSDEGLEIQMEEDSEFDFDFSPTESESINSKTNTKNKTEANPKIESISPIEMEFSTDEDIESDEEDVFDEEYYDASEEQIKDFPSNSQNSQQKENKISLTKSQNQQTTLGGQPITGNSSGQGSTLLGNRPNLFEDSILFDRHKSSALGIKKIIPIILIIILIAGFAASIMMGVKNPYLSAITPYIEKIPYINKILSPKPEPIKLTPDQKSVSGKFITNTISGTLFVITGQVTNHSKTICKDIKIEGTLIATNKVKVKTKTVLCGNIIPEEQLKTLDMNGINSILYSSDGNKKFTVDPGKSIPFMVVFSDFPDNLENFTVVVTDFKQADSKK
ncbi:MAG: DUF3426 domain-containing protein, partial [Desulfamplus sp.]|nr:DUF3426 domain-containing protein [Desulfamplus sp.]